MRRNQRIAIAFFPALGLTLAALSSILLAGEAKDFKHKFHLEKGADCQDCHEMGGKQPALKKEFCNDCHDKGPPAWKLPAPASRLKAVFQHPAHLKMQKCQDCHQPVAEDSELAGQPLLARKACLTCHQQKNVAISEGSCARCHGVDERKVKPEDHRHAWLERHGKEPEWRASGEHGRDCAVCHRQDSCASCHRSIRPRSHTALWRMRTHGFAAEWERESCKTCHETGTCVRCHQTLKPLNHVGAWRSEHGLAAESTGNEHCAVCHSQGWCARCHQK